ncbi:recQ-mediated genome instability protein 1-like isoform X1 [Acropora millepora]|uniref:recQ-mediated genome instability protein 1-like isoform X1 n=1 Tax=Acropora millepora TaxID=45264 RepID=UPI001CF13E5C|nr:recQ-mediated genome instability protein 1-like isoform X1 [Acropora millepora]
MAASGIRSWLESRHVYIQNEWLEACIDFVKEDNEERQLTPLELNDLVYEQWLMADIQESSVPRLPGEIGNVEICKVEGYFNLQINSVLNVGEAAYSQIQKLKGQDDPEELNWKTNPSEPKIKPSRMLLFEITDGTQTLFGMEYQLIPFLKVTTPPGTKIQVVGPVTCRLGALLLTANNVKVLGGSVQLLEGNSFWNVLHQTIGQDPPQQPSTSSKAEAIQYEGPQNPNNATAHEVNNGIQRSSKPSIAMQGGEKRFTEIQGKVEGCGSDGNRAAQSSRFKAELLHDEEFFGEEDDDVIAAVTDEDFFGDGEEIIDMDQIDSLEMETLGAKRKATCEMEKSGTDDLEMLCGDNDVIFEDDFNVGDLVPGDKECVERKPAYSKDCPKESLQEMHQSKKARISNSNSWQQTSFSALGEKDSLMNDPDVLFCEDSDNDIFKDDFISENHVVQDLRCTEIEPTHENIFCRENSGPVTQPRLSMSADVNSTSWNPKSSISSLNTNMISAWSSSVKTEPSLPMRDSRSKFIKTETQNPLKINSAPLKNYSPNRQGDKFSIHLPKVISKTSDLQIQPGSSKNNNSITTAAQAIHSNDIQDCRLHESHIKEIPELQAHSVPFVSLSETVTKFPGRQNCIIRVKAYIATIVSRSKPLSPNWNVIVRLNDGTDTVDADLSEKVLSELLEFPVDEYRRDMQEVFRTRDTALRERLQMVVK